MQGSDPAGATRQSTRFLYLYALAVSGGAVAYIPFLTILLPLRVTAIAGNNALAMLAFAAFLGAIAASVANIGFGWASDVTGTRRPWIAAGLILSSILLVAMPAVNSAPLLIGMIMVWQICLNMMLAPLAAWAGDCIPDGQKGMLGGLLALAPALGALSGAFVTVGGYVTVNGREIMVAALVAVMVGPVLLFGRPHPMPTLMPQKPDEYSVIAIAPTQRSAAVRMWMARLLVQIAEASLFAFLLLWFRSLDPRFEDGDVAVIFAAVLGLAVLFALFIGHWSDRNERPIVPLVWGSGFAALGLFIMAVASSLPVAISGYVLFGLSSSIFLALHSSQTLRVLPRPHSRGRDLGLFNLTNTVPSLIMPWLTLAIVPVYGFNALFALLAALASIGWFLLLTMPKRLTDA